MGLNMCFIAAIIAVFLAGNLSPAHNVHGLMTGAVESSYKFGGRFNESNRTKIFEDGIKQYNHISMRNLLFASNGLDDSNEEVDDDASDSGTCQLPSKTSHSTLLCVRYPTYVVCKQTCTFGHTLSGGVSRDYKCIHEENRWVPTDQMEECLPFIDCGLKMVGSGRYTCNTTDANGNGPVCRIACNHYEDKPSVKEASYQCDNNGKWSPNLPHCVAVKGDKTLVPAPRGIKYLR